MLDDWVAAAKNELGIDAEFDVGTVLDVARVAAHTVERPAAPVTTFLLGYAAARREGDETLSELSEQVVTLARRWRSNPADD